MSQAPVPLNEPGLLTRMSETQRERVTFFLDGQALTGLRGDTVLTAVLMHRKFARYSDESGAHRAGFCWMGACQDCWISSEAGDRFKACSTMLEPSMKLISGQGGST